MIWEEIHMTEVMASNVPQLTALAECFVVRTARTYLHTYRLSVLHDRDDISH